jgi:hypothetical protein
MCCPQPNRLDTTDLTAAYCAAVNDRDVDIPRCRGRSDHWTPHGLVKDALDSFSLAAWLAIPRYHPAMAKADAAIPCSGREGCIEHAFATDTDQQDRRWQDLDRTPRCFEFQALAPRGKFKVKRTRPAQVFKKCEPNLGSVNTSRIMLTGKYQLCPPSRRENICCRGG